MTVLKSSSSVVLTRISKRMGSSNKCFNSIVVIDVDALR